MNYFIYDFTRFWILVLTIENLFLNGGSSVYSHESHFEGRIVSGIHQALKNWTFKGKNTSGWPSIKLSSSEIEIGK